MLCCFASDNWFRFTPTHHQTMAEKDMTAGFSSMTENKHEGKTESAETVQDCGQSSAMELESCQAEVTSTEAPSLMCLPDLVLLKLMRMSFLKERHKLSLTCHKFNSLLYHPSLWRCAILPFSFSGGGVSVSRMPSKTIEIVQEIGKHLQDVTLELFSFCDYDLEEKTKQLMTSLCGQWRLQTLRLALTSAGGGVGSRSAYLRGDTVLTMIHHILQTAVTLKKLEVKAWPVFGDCLGDLLMCTPTAHLHSLSIFFKLFGHSHGSLTSDHSAAVSRLVSRCSSLQHLSLQEHLLSDELLYNLAECGMLKTLNLLVGYTIPSYPRAVEMLAPKAWRKLSENKPNLEVNIKVIRCKEWHLSHLFLPCIPITSVKMFKISDCNTQLLTLLPQYANTLKSFICQVMIEDIDNDLFLLTLIKRCHRLRHLCFWAHIYSSTLLKVARDRQWETLRFQEKSILTKPRQPELEDEEITAFQGNSKGRIVLKSVENNFKRQKLEETEESRAEEMKRLRQALSECTGCYWALDWSGLVLVILCLILIVGQLRRKDCSLTHSFASYSEWLLRYPVRFRVFNIHDMYAHTRAHTHMCTHTHTHIHTHINMHNIMVILYKEKKLSLGKC